MEHYKLPKNIRDKLYRYIDTSGLPHNEVKEILSWLTQLEKIEDEDESEQSDG